MNNSRIQAKAQVIDARAKTDKILYASAALLIGLLAVAVFSTNVRAADSASTTETKVQTHDETVVMPFQLKSQKLGH